VHGPLTQLVKSVTFMVLKCVVGNGTNKRKTNHSFLDSFVLTVGALEVIVLVLLVSYKGKEKILPMQTSEMFLIHLLLHDGR